MNIKELKKRTEQAIKIVMESMVDKDVQVNVNYNIEEGVIVTSLIKSLNVNTQQTSTAYYHFNFKEETKMLSFAAINRHAYSDRIGVYNVAYEPIFLDEEFINHMKNGIIAGLEHTDEIIAQYEAANAEAPATNETNETEAA